MPPKPEELFHTASQHLFVAGVGDVAERLSALNMTFGLAKILHYQHSRGVRPDALFIGAPDTTVTRNTNRWLQGMGYGGILQWGGEFSVLDTKPNGCGVLMGRLPKPLSREAVREKWTAVQREGLKVDAQAIQWDLTTGNHFLELLRPSEKEISWDLPWRGPVFLIHSSGKEYRSETPLGPGLYWDRSRRLQELMTRHSTPWGDLLVLEGKEAEAYTRHCAEVHLFQMRRRETLAKALLGEFEVLFHGTHQGMASPGTAVLGCYKFGPKKHPHMIQGPEVESYPTVCPLTLRVDLPVSLMEPLPNFTTEAMEALGWSEAAKRLPSSQRLQQAHILPHGGGTAYPYLETPWARQKDGTRRFGACVKSNLDHRKDPLSQLQDRSNIQFSVDRREVEFENPRNLPFSYRGRQVLAKTLQNQMGRERGRLEILWSLGGEG